MTQPAVLIVEDDASLREALFDTLNSSEQPVLTAENGPDALDIIDHEPVGLVVSDLQMEPMDGVTLLGKIREQYCYRGGQYKWRKRRNKGRRVKQNPDLFS